MRSTNETLSFLLTWFLTRRSEIHRLTRLHFFGHGPQFRENLEELRVDRLGVPEQYHVLTVLE